MTIIRGPSLVVSARVCAALVTVVDEVEARARRLGVDVDPEVTQTLAELRELAAWWRERASAPNPPRVDEPAEAPAPSPAMLTADIAAARLGITGRRVRQRLARGELAGIRVAGRWWVDPAAVNGAGRG